MGSNAQIIQGVYAALRTGDMPAVLAAMAPEIVWNEAENFPYADNKH
jgi:ketosteroid isomerase-like protein